MSSFAERLTWIITTLCGALGAYGRRIASPPQPVWLGTRCYMPAIAPERLPRLPTALWNLFIQRVQRTAARISLLHEQWRAGTIQPTRPRAPRPKPEPARAPVRLPRAFAWANARARELADPAGMLHVLLQETPDSQRFLTEVPRAARLVRPLCQALGVTQPPWLRLPPRPRAPRKPRPPRPRPIPLTDPSLGLQPYVIAAVRHARKNRL